MVEPSRTPVRSRWRDISKKTEMRDAADLDAGSVSAQRILQTAFDGPVVALFLHVDEVNHD